MRNFHKIATYHCNLFRLHDEEKWKEFHNNVVNYSIALGYDGAKAKRAAGYVVKAYKHADDALAAQKQERFALEDIKYGKTFSEFLTAHRILGTETHSLDYKIGWYKGARHRNHALVLRSLLMGNIAKFGWQELFLALYVTYLSFAEAYPAHKYHDWKRLTRALEKYWVAVDAAYPGRKRLPIEL